MNKGYLNGRSDWIHLHIPTNSKFLRVSQKTYKLIARRLQLITDGLAIIVGNHNNTDFYPIVNWQKNNPFLLRLNNIHYILAQHLPWHKDGGKEEDEEIIYFHSILFSDLHYRVMKEYKLVKRDTT